MREDTLIECLKYTPNLRTNSIDCTNTTLRALTVDDSDPSTILCPSLQCLKLGGAAGFSNDTMKALILSRWGANESHNAYVPGKELKQVGYRPRPTDKWLESDHEIAKCINEGFSFSDE
ncbi:hypothetical protein BD410DRAFT_789918 [Rickenella mellea]|uniref:Uncharacterized protein n=1 Tax=Rickenella mellea TaxID=50990 RepID=A0A4Y7Q0K2_9AGAM|nr:hypothetical protein BD410DRAFT_789918 [Rickenella mellea]